LAAVYGARFLDLSREGAADSPGAGRGTEPDIAIDCTGDRLVWERLAGLVRPGGEVLLFGGCAPGTLVGFDAARLHYAEITLSGSFHYTPSEARAALAALASGAVDPRPLVSARGALADVPRFLRAQGRGEGVRYAIGMPV
ncbi:MAG TPA: zinc-binding dehydrogenase, partial [Thermoanaerobaculia bacterium]